MTPDQLKEWERLAREATPGEWLSDRRGVVWVRSNDRGVAVTHCVLGGAAKRNAAFIAAAREAVPALCERVRELEDENDNLRDDSDSFWKRCFQGANSAATELIQENDSLRQRVRELERSHLEALELWQQAKRMEESYEERAQAECDSLRAALAELVAADTAMRLITNYDECTAATARNKAAWAEARRVLTSDPSATPTPSPQPTPGCKPQQ